MQVTSNCSVSSTRIDLPLPFVLERPSTFGTETAGKSTGHLSTTRAYRRSKQARSAIKEAAGTLVASRKLFTPSMPRLGSVKHSYLVHSWVDQPHSATQRQHTTYELMLEIPSIRSRSRPHYQSHQLWGRHSPRDQDRGVTKTSKTKRCISLKYLMYSIETNRRLREGFVHA